MRRTAGAQYRTERLARTILQPEPGKRASAGDSTVCYVAESAAEVWEARQEPTYVRGMNGRYPPFGPPTPPFYTHRTSAWAFKRE